MNDPVDIEHDDLLDIDPETDRYRDPSGPAPRMTGLDSPAAVEHKLATGIIVPAPRAAALFSLEEAAREAHRTQLAAQAAAKRYAEAVKRLSELAIAEAPLAE
ncbi:MAG: hypothetical protein ACREJC_09730 [Tepidisphaeraceae bacterium]